VTKFKSQSFRLHSKSGVACVQRVGCAVSSQHVRQSQGARGGPNSGIFFFELVSRLLCCAYASYSTENKGLLTYQALVLSKESLFRQQGFGPSCKRFLFYACCFTDRTGYYKPKLPKTQGVTGYRWVCLSRTGQLPSWGLAVSLVSLLLLPLPQMRYKRFLRQRSRTQKGVLVDLLCLQGPPLKHRLAQSSRMFPGPTYTYGPYCGVL